MAEGALLLAALDRPRVGLERYRRHLQELAEAVAAHAAMSGAAGAAVEAQATALNAVLLGDFGYAGDRRTYDDPQNANLIRVIDRRRGLPVALAILYLSAARAQGWQAAALRFPGHVLLRLSGGGQRLIFDPFNEGRSLDAAALRQLAKAIGGAGAELTLAHTEPLTNRELLLRLQNNIMLRQRQAAQHQAALTVLESMLLLAPDDWTLWRQAAELHVTLENLRAATLALGNVLALTEDQRVRHEAARLLQELRARLN